MAEAITVRISDELLRQLRRASELSKRPIDEIVATSLAHSLPPLLQDIPQEYQAGVFPLLEMDDAALQAEMRRVFDARQWQRYEALLDLKKERPLTAAENAELDRLRYAADLLMFRKGYAAVLLKQRGIHVPGTAGLPTVK